MKFTKCHAKFLEIAFFSQFHLSNIRQSKLAILPVTFLFFFTVYSFLFQVTMAGDFILAVASMMIARLRNDEVTLTLSQVCLFFLTCLN